MKYVKLCSFYFNYLNFLYLKIVILFTSLTKNDEYIGTKIKFFFPFNLYGWTCRKLLCTCRTRFSCTTYTCADILKFMFLINPFIKRTLKKKLKTHVEFIVHLSIIHYLPQQCGYHFAIQQKKILMISFWGIMVFSKNSTRYFEIY
jgi:hypothetical protein